MTPTPTLPLQGEGEESARQKKICVALRAAAPGRVHLAATMLYRGRDRARLARAQGPGARGGRAADRRQRRALSPSRPPRRSPTSSPASARRLIIDRAGARLAANAERFLKPGEEMARLFRDAPEAIEETLHLSEQLTFSLDELRYEYPDETIDGFHGRAGRR